MERHGEPTATESTTVQGRWVWKQIFVPWLAPPEHTGRSEKSAAAERPEFTPTRPRLDSIDARGWFRGDAGQEERSVTLSDSQIADRLSSTAENPQAVNRTPTPDTASAKHMKRKRLEDQTAEEAGESRAKFRKGMRQARQSRSESSD